MKIYDLAKTIYGNDKKKIAEAGGKYPLTTRTIAMINSDYLLDLLEGLEVSVDDAEASFGVENKKVEKPVKEESKPAKTTKKAKEEKKEELEGSDYESMTAKNLYALCCERGISSKCKNRQKATLIQLLKDYDAGKLDEEPKVEEEENFDDWELEGKEETKNPYEGKKAKELYDLCKERGIKVKPRQKADAYIKLLVEYDNKAEEQEETDDEDWDF